MTDESSDHQAEQPTPQLGPPEHLWCTKHKKFHHRDMFYDNPRGKYGKSSWCKSAMKSRNKRLRYQQKGYDSAQTLARRAVQNALKKGQLVKPQRCVDWSVQGVFCDGARLEAHHKEGYKPDKWLIVDFVCHQHHNLRENKSAKDARR